VDYQLKFNIMKRVKFFLVGLLALALINVVGLTFSNSQVVAMNGSQLQTSLTEEEEGPKCWSELEYSYQDMVLRCLTCDWITNYTGKGRHDGHCKDVVIPD
jgi:hypothetical protein